jgi:hypothetical protein
LGKSPLEGYPSHPLPQRVENLRNLHMEKAWLQSADAKSRHGIGTLRNGERGENNAKLNNTSTVQHFDAGFQMKIVKTLLILIVFTKCAYLLLSSLASKNCVLYSEGRVYKREPELAASPQSTTLHSTGNTSVKKGVSRTKSATATHVE